MREDHLRPVERRVIAMRDEGVHITEIARRIDKSPAHVERVISWTDIPRNGPPARRSPTAIEQRVMKMRTDGDSYAEIAARFKRGPKYIKQVEGLGHYSLGLDLLT
jgi:DNA-binding CsgD family transcriptional regulator